MASSFPLPCRWQRKRRWVLEWCNTKGCEVLTVRNGACWWQYLTTRSSAMSFWVMSILCTDGALIFTTKGRCKQLPLWAVVWGGDCTVTWSLVLDILLFEVLILDPIKARQSYSAQKSESTLVLICNLLSFFCSWMGQSHSPSAFFKFHTWGKFFSHQFSITPTLLPEVFQLTGAWNAGCWSLSHSVPRWYYKKRKNLFTSHLRMLLEFPRPMR